MESRIIILPNGDFEVVPEKPYEFAREREIEEKIANDERRKTEKGLRSKEGDREGFRERNGYVPGGDWGSGD